MGAWFDEQVAASLDDLLGSLSIGEEVRDLERCDALSLGIEGVFRSDAATQYAAWPPESTTDGTSIHLCFRSDEDTIEIAGVTWIDFDGSVFPFRAEVRRTPNRSASVLVFIGEVDDRTGAPPRMPAGTLILPVRDSDDLKPVAELLLGRRQLPITWTKAFEVALGLS